MAHVERVVVTEMGTVIGVGNAAIMVAVVPVAVVAVVATVVGNGLLLLPSGLLTAGALWLRWLRLLDALRLLLRAVAALTLRRLLRALCLLASVAVPVWRAAVAAPGVVPAVDAAVALLRAVPAVACCGLLAWCCAAWGFSSASALFLFAFLCECRNGGSEK